jgi:uncharacterized protein YndB with AHSA1/START domain
MKTDHHILLVNDLASFTQEVPPGKVRLNLTERLTFTGEYHIPRKNVFLSLQGVNPEGEIVWLMDTWTISVRPGGGNESTWIPWTPKEQSLYEGATQAHRLVREYLAELNYDVRNGQYGIPKNIEPTRGEFECFRWIKNDDGETYHVERVSPVEKESTDA